MGPNLPQISAAVRSLGLDYTDLPFNISLALVWPEFGEAIGMGELDTYLMPPEDIDLPFSPIAIGWMAPAFILFLIIGLINEMVATNTSWGRPLQPILDEIVRATDWLAGTTHPYCNLGGPGDFPMTFEAVVCALTAFILLWLLVFANEIIAAHTGWGRPLQPAIDGIGRAMDSLVRPEYVRHDLGELPLGELQMSIGALACATAAFALLWVLAFVNEMIAANTRLGRPLQPLLDELGRAIDWLVGPTQPQCDFGGFPLGEISMSVGVLVCMLVAFALVWVVAFANEMVASNTRLGRPLQPLLDRLGRAIDWLAGPTQPRPSPRSPLSGPSLPSISSPSIGDLFCFFPEMGIVLVLLAWWVILFIISIRKSQATESIKIFPLPLGIDFSALPVWNHVPSFLADRLPMEKIKNPSISIWLRPYLLPGLCVIIIPLMFNGLKVAVWGTLCILGLTLGALCEYHFKVKSLKGAQLEGSCLNPIFDFKTPGRSLINNLGLNFVFPLSKIDAEVGPCIDNIAGGLVKGINEARLFYQGLWFDRKYKKTRRKVKKFFERPTKTRRYWYLTCRWETRAGLAWLGVPFRQYPQFKPRNTFLGLIIRRASKALGGIVGALRLGAFSPCLLALLARGVRLIKFLWFNRPSAIHSFVDFFQPDAPAYTRGGYTMTPPARRPRLVNLTSDMEVFASKGGSLLVFMFLVWSFFARVLLVLCLICML